MVLSHVCTHKTQTTGGLPSEFELACAAGILELFYQLYSPIWQNGEVVNRRSFLNYASFVSVGVGE